MPPRPNPIPDDLRQSVEELAAQSVTSAALNLPKNSNLKLPEFEGKTSEDVEEWLFSLQLNFDANDTAADKRVKLAAASLRGAALTWWRAQMLSKKELAPSTWDAFADSITAAFQPINPIQAARDKLDNLKQTTSVAAYAHAFRNLALRIPDLSDADKLQRFIHGLKLNTQREIKIRAPSTFEDAVNMADRYDSIVYDQQRQARRAADPPRRRFDNNAGGSTRSELAAINASDTKPTTQRYTKLTPELRQQLLKEGKCFYCRQSGHTANSCPAKSSKTFPNAPRQ